MARNRSWMGIFVALAALGLALTPVAAGQKLHHAGKVTLILPKVQLTRGSGRLTAQPPMDVYWGDVVNTGPLARARLALDDGSILNVGSNSFLRVIKHDASNQQTEIDLAYGQVRTKAVKLTKPGAKFHIRTPTGVAGVVGTDFYLAYVDRITRLVVYEGKVQFCNLKAKCVLVGAGSMSAIRGPNNSPDQPVHAPNTDLMQATTNTEISAASHGVLGLTGFAAAHPILVATVAVVATVVPATAIRAMSTTHACTCQGVVQSSPSTGGVTIGAPTLRFLLPRRH